MESSQSEVDIQTDFHFYVYRFINNNPTISSFFLVTLESNSSPGVARMMAMNESANAMAMIQ